MSNTEFDAPSSGVTGALRRRTAATAFACVGWLTLAATGAHAANALRDVAYTALPGGKVELRLSFDSPPALPNGFTTDTPPTIALDFSDTRNELGKRRLEVSTGATSGLNIVEAGGRTRVVIGLFRPASYVSRINANQLVVTVNNGIGESANYVAAASAGNPTKAVAATSRSNTLNNIDFRRGKDGEGRIVLSFAQAGAAVDLKREGDRIVLDLLNVDVLPAQARRLDVTDFATPVRSIDARSSNGRAQLEIMATSPYEQSAYQAGNDYVLEIGPKKVDDKIANRDAPPVYNGARVTFNFQDIPVRSVLQLIAEESNFNIVVADSVQGNVTLRLLNVPWDQALDLVLRAKGLDKRSQGNVIWVGPQEEIAKYEQDLAAARMKRLEQDELVSDIIPISYGKAKDIVELLTKDTQSGQTAGGQGQTGSSQRGFLSTRGSVTYDERTNTLLISDTPAKIAEIRQLVATLDRPVQQVLIESRIVIATDSFARELGAKFGISGGYTDNNGNVVGVSGNAASAGSVANQAYLNRLGVGGLGGTSPIGDPLLTRDRLNVNLPAAVGGGGSFGLAILGADYLLDLELSANQTEGRTEVLSSPRVVTANNTEAVIKQGQEIGYVTVQGGAGGVGTATVQFKEAVLELKVTPTITADDRVYLNLNVKKDALNRFVDNPGGGQVPQLDKREVTTGVLVDNGQTVVLGGVYEVSKADSQTKVPLLGDIPVLGNLFRKKGRNDTKAELLIFVTPRILSDSLK